MTYYFGKTTQYDERKCDDYIAYEYPIVYTDIDKGYYEPQKQTPGFFIDATTKELKNTVSKYTLKPLNAKHKFLPILHQNTKNSSNIQRDVCVVFGASGSGKSTTTTKMAQIYKGLNPENKIYYISSKNMLIDPSFKKDLYQFISFDDFMERFSIDEELDEFRTGHELDNSLIIFDDLIFKNNKLKQKFYDGFMTIVLNLKRMNYISLIYCMHEMSDYKNTRTLFNEMTMYICFSCDLKNRSSLILKDKLKLTKEEIQKITSSSANSRFSCILTRARCVITENEIFSVVD